ncbi:MAG: hypothetical protein NT062_24815 [Proteobacteria bacterium]|nr:hypothetical protein [Pseudomonadota bacterium]
MCAREVRARRDDLVDDVRGLLLLAERQDALPDPAQPTPDLLMEHDDDEDDEVADQVVEQPRHRRQPHALGDEEGRPDQHDADDHLRRAGAADREQQAIDQVVDQRDVDDGRHDDRERQAGEELLERINHPILVYTASASRSNATL